MAKHLLLVDYENVQGIDMSLVDESFRAIVFVGATQNAPKAASRLATAHRFRRVEFQKISGLGKNALDFHIAFQLGRIFETDAKTVCIVVSGDRGFDPLLDHLNRNGMRCLRVGAFSDVSSILGADPAVFACDRCQKINTIEHNGGRWCPLCGRFASPPDPTLEPSSRRAPRELLESAVVTHTSEQVCGWCHQRADMSDGIYDDDEWMCGGCIAQYAS